MQLNRVGGVFENFKIIKPGLNKFVVRGNLTLDRAAGLVAYPGSEAAVAGLLREAGFENRVLNVEVLRRARSVLSQIKITPSLNPLTALVTKLGNPEDRGTSLVSFGPMDITSVNIGDFTLGQLLRVGEKKFRRLTEPQTQALAEPQIKYLDGDHVRWLNIHWLTAEQFTWLGKVQIKATRPEQFQQLSPTRHIPVLTEEQIMGMTSGHFQALAENIGAITLERFKFMIKTKQFIHLTPEQFEVLTISHVELLTKSDIQLLSPEQFAALILHNDRRVFTHVLWAAMKP